MTDEAQVGLFGLEAPFLIHQLDQPGFLIRKIDEGVDFRFELVEHQRSPPAKCRFRGVDVSEEMITHVEDLLTGQTEAFLHLIGTPPEINAARFHRTQMWF